MSLRQTEITTPEQVSLRFHVAGLGSRAAAHLMDVVILGIIFFSITFGLFWLDELIFERLDETLGFDSSSYLIAILMILSFVLIWGYFALFEFIAGGRTPGKMLLGLRVIQENGQSITFLSAFVRNLLRIVDFLPTFYLVGMISCFFHSQHKRIGDLVAGTIVVYERGLKKKKRKTPLLKEIEERGVQANTLSLDQWSVGKLTVKEWKLLSAYMDRRHILSKKELNQLTMHLGRILLPMVDLSITGKPLEEIENDLFALYLILKEEWEFEGLTDEPTR